MQDKGPFDHLGLDPAVVKAVDAIGYEALTPIREAALRQDPYSGGGNPVILAS